MTQTTTGKKRQFSDRQWAKSGAESTVTGTTWTSKVQRTFNRVAAGEYQLTWSCLIAVNTGSSAECEVRFMKDFARFGFSHTQPGDTKDLQVSGILYESYNADDQPDLEIEFRRQGGSAGNEVAIKRAFIAIVRVGD